MRFFRFAWADVRAGRVDVWTAANCAAHIPRGGAVGEFYGGHLAVSADVEALWEANYLLALAVTDKPKRVKPRPFPDGVRSAKIREARESRVRANRERALRSMERLYRK